MNYTLFPEFLARNVGFNGRITIADLKLAAYMERTRRANVAHFEEVALWRDRERLGYGVQGV